MKRSLALFRFKVFSPSPVWSCRCSLPVAVALVSLRLCSDMIFSKAETDLVCIDSSWSQWSANFFGAEVSLKTPNAIVVTASRLQLMVALPIKLPSSGTEFFMRLNALPQTFVVSQNSLWFGALCWMKFITFTSPPRHKWEAFYRAPFNT